MLVGLVDVLYLNCPTPMKPVMSLSNTWNPRQYSSGSPGSRKPPGRFRILEKDSKSTVHYEVSHCILEIAQTLRPFQSCTESGFPQNLDEKSATTIPRSENKKGHIQSPPTLPSSSWISASVGFCPHARSRSPRD